jgi:hypothetical protein
VVNIAELLELLKKNSVIIKFKHWRTDEELSIVATLDESVTEVKLKQYPSSNVIVVYDVIGDNWEDIRVETIIDYASVESVYDAFVNPLKN